jgi:hypothetical protein
MWKQLSNAGHNLVMLFAMDYWAKHNSDELK